LVRVPIIRELPHHAVSSEKDARIRSGIPERPVCASALLIASLMERAVSRHARVTRSLFRATPVFGLGFSRHHDSRL
jgi:hypothetical protein